MIRILFSVIVAIHAIVHLMGFMKEWNLGPTEALSIKTYSHFSDNTLKFMGILWLVTCIVLIIAAASFYSKKDWFWIAAGAGILLSQILIILYWNDAKWGTLLNVMLAIVIALAAGSLQFNNLVTNETNTLIAKASKGKTYITVDMIDSLPPVVKTWLRNSNIIGKQLPRLIHVTQKGSLRTDAHGEWLPFEAEQHFSIEPAAFVWKARIRAGKFIDIVGRDKYENGEGNMLIKAASLIPLASSSGKEIDQGTMIRFMAEIIWFPHAAVSHYFTWQEIDAHHARLSMHYNGIAASGIYTFNENGLPVSFEAKRYRELDGKFSLETWSINVTSYRSFENIPLANASEVTWKLKEGNFTWLKLDVIDIDYK